MVIDRKIGSFTASAAPEKRPVNTEPSNVDGEHLTMEEVNDQRKFEKDNDLKAFCQETWEELNGDNSLIPVNIYKKVFKSLYRDNKDQITDKDYVQADAKKLLKQMVT